MAEKWEKVFSVPKSRGKTLTNGGKGGGKPKIVLDTSSSDSDSEPSPSPTPKTPTTSTKSKSNVNWDKSGGKGSVLGEKSTKPETPKPLPTPKFEIEQELPKNAKCMMDAEALDVLQKIQDHLVILSEDSTIKLPDSFHKGLQYAKSGGGYTNTESAKLVLGKLKKQKVTESEICLIGNICAESVDEVFALMPNLKEKKRKGEIDVEDVLCDLIKLRSG